MPLGSELIFILSAPRSGSTLLQRLLDNSPDLCTDVESWLMLHPVYSLRESGITTDYTHKTARGALLHFCENFDFDHNVWLEAVRGYADTFYLQALKRSGGRYFLDKTPPYTRIIKELQLIYPQAKFIYLLRNPLALLHSALNTWVKGEWDNLYWCRYDLIGALQDLVDGLQSDDVAKHVVRFEDLVTSPKAVLSNIESFLGVSFEGKVEYKLPRSRQDGSVSKQSAYKLFQGDPERISRNRMPQANYADKWVELAAHPQAQHFANAYLDALGDDLIQRLGYDGAALRQKMAFSVHHKVMPGSLIPWEIAVKPRTERTLRERLVIRRAKAIREHGFVKGVVMHGVASWHSEARALLHTLRSGGRVR